MTPEELFEEKQYLVFAAIKQRFGSITRATQIAEMNNMELDDVIQVGRMYLWEHCLKYDPERMKTFNAYVMKGMKWAMSTELHTKGRTIGVSRHVSPEERNRLHFHSIDLFIEGETESGYFAVSPINVEEEVMLSIEFQEVMSVLEEKEKSIILHIGEGYTPAEIAMKFEMGYTTVNTKKNKAFLKINPDYKPMKQTSFFKGKRTLKNHLHQQVI